MRSMTIMTVLTMLVAAPVAAQQAGGMGGMSMGGGEEGGAMGPLTAKFGMYAPAAVVAIKEHLNLTAAQSARIAELDEAGKKAEREAHEPAHAAHMELNKTLAAESVDMEKARAMFLAHHNAEGVMQWVRVSTAMEVKALLTPPQRSMVERMAGPAGHH
jgi:Spy/CpxP family protein refolding chaperone